MVSNTEVFPEFDKIFLNNGESILDVGCGGSGYESHKFDDWWNRFVFFKKRVGIDIYQKEIDWRILHFPQDTFIIMNAIDIDKQFGEKSFDVVHCQNVVEHLEKDKAIELIKKMEKIARKQIILGTPKGFRQSDEATLARNPFEEHKFAFTKEELEKLGYNVITIGDYFLCYKNLSPMIIGNTSICLNKKLNLGCGFNKKPIEEGWVNIDKDASVNPDIVRDLEKGLPFDDNSIDEIYAHHVLEHTEDFIFVLSEIYRVCKNGAEIEIEVPLGITDDPTHKTFFTPTSFEHWCEPLEKKTGWKQDYYGSKIKFKKIYETIINTPQPVLRIILQVIK